MIIIFDLDYTLLDTKRFKDGLAEVFNKENFYADHKKYFKDVRVNFNSEKYLAILKNEGRIDEKREQELRRGLSELFNHMDNYLFSEAENILKRLKSDGAELVLFTFGDKAWHEKKVKSLSIKKFFSHVVYEDKNKGESQYLKSLSKIDEEILMVNDNARETKEMADTIGPKAKVFLIDGPYAENIEHDWPIHELAELNKITL